MLNGDPLDPQSICLNIFVWSRQVLILSGKENGDRKENDHKGHTQENKCCF